MRTFLATTIATAALSGAAWAGGHGATNSPIGQLPNAQPGQCFARIVTPAQYEQVPETVVVQEGYQTLHALQPEFRDSSVEVMVKEAGVQYVVRQPRYEVRKEQVMVKPGHERLVIEPAKFDYVTETITVGEARKVWKPGANLSSTQRVDARTGQVYCLVEIPAKTKTITRRVMVQPEQVKRVAVDAQYINVSKQVLVDRGGVEEIPVPAEYRNIPTQELAAPARAEKRPVAPKTATVERTVLRAPEKFEWVEVLCDTNATTSNISDVQRALADRGFYNGPIDGILGPKTQAGLEAFQTKNGLPHQGYVTIETLRALGLAPAGVSHPPRKPRPMQKKPVHTPDGASMKPAAHHGAHGYGSAPVRQDAPMQLQAPKELYEPQGGPVELQGDWQEGGVGETTQHISANPAFEQAEPRREYSVRRRLNWEGK